MNMSTGTSWLRARSQGQRAASGAENCGRRGRLGRRRPLLGVLGVVLSALVVAVPTIASAASSAKPSKLVIGYFNGATALPSTIIGSNKALNSSIGVPVVWHPITTTGVAAMEELRGGAIDAMSGIGVPPVVSSIAQGTKLTVVWAENGDSDVLVVPNSITSPSQLVGKTIGVTEGSTEAYELAGYLTANHLTSKVHVALLDGAATIYAAYVSGHIQGGYLPGSWVDKLEAGGKAHGLTNAIKIAQVGYPSMSVDVVSTAIVKQYPATVQNFVCSLYHATQDMFGSNASSYFRASAGLVGIPAAAVVKATVPIVPTFVKPSDELSWLAGAHAELLTSYTKVATYLAGLKAIPKAPSASVLASHIDPSFAKTALSGGCM
jgi:taurine transport system substrate-binding protein